MLTSFADDEAFLGAVIAGASGYVLKQIRGNDLVDSVRRAARGESLLDPCWSPRLERVSVETSKMSACGPFLPRSDGSSN